MNQNTLNRKKDLSGVGSRCDEKCEAPPTAFRRSSLVMRSPPVKQAVCSTENVSGTSCSASKDAEILLDTPTCTRGAPGSSAALNDARDANSHPIDTVQTGKDVVAISETDIAASMWEGSPRLELIYKMRKMEEEAISQCQSTLSGMQRAINRQRNISIEVKTGISKMAELLDVIMNYRRTWKKTEGERTFSNLRRNVATLELSDVPTPRTTNSKRAATSPAISGSSKKARAKTPSIDEIEVIEKNDGNWQTVVKKGGKRGNKPKGKISEAGRGNKSRPRAVRPEAVIVKPAEGRSYAEVLRNLRAKMVTDDSARIRSVRKTMSGAILLEFAKGEKVAPEFVNQLRNTVCETASISELKPMATVEIRDLDSLSDKEEVEAAVRKLLPNQGEQLRVRVTTPNPRDQVRAFITLSAESAAKLVQHSDIRIGFIRTRMRLCEEIKRCYRCLGTGHFQSNCKGPDRRNVCIRCGTTGHKMKECRAPLKCVLCLDAKRDQTNHLMGSKSCLSSRK